MIALPEGVDQETIEINKDLRNKNSYTVKWTYKEKDNKAEEFSNFGKIERYFTNTKSTYLVRKYLDTLKENEENYFTDDEISSLFNKEVNWEKIRTLLEEKE